MFRMIKKNIYLLLIFSSDACITNCKCKVGQGWWYSL